MASDTKPLGGADFSAEEFVERAATRFEGLTIETTGCF
jgi:hypothetical protein